MKQNNYNDHSVVKTSDLIYVFSAAAWVNVLTNNFAENSNGLCFLLAFLSFSLIPLELYTGSLWQQAVMLVDKDKSDDALQQSILATIDIFRLFSLTMAFVLLYIPLGELKAWYIGIHSETKLLEAYVIFIALFLSSNWMWNQILFKNWFIRRSKGDRDFYNEILQKYRGLMDEKLAEISSNAGLNQKQKDFFQKQIGFGADFTVSFGKVNRFIFQWVFLFIFIFLFFIASMSFFFEGLRYWLASAVGWLSLGIFGIQIVAKLVQIIYFSNAVSDIRSADIASGPQGAGA